MQRFARFEKGDAFNQNELALFAAAYGGRGLRLVRIISRECTFGVSRSTPWREQSNWRVPDLHRPAMASTTGNDCANLSSHRDQQALGYATPDPSELISW